LGERREREGSGPLLWIDRKYRKNNNRTNKNLAPGPDSVGKEGESNAIVGRGMVTWRGREGCKKNSRGKGRSNLKPNRFLFHLGLTCKNHDRV